MFHIVKLFISKFKLPVLYVFPLCPIFVKIKSCIHAKLTKVMMVIHSRIQESSNLWLVHRTEVVCG